MTVRTGLDRLADDDEISKLIRGKRIGLLAHAASVDQRLLHAQSIVSSFCDLAVLFAPEHGYQGAAQDMARLSDAEAAQGPSADTNRKQPKVISLYGDSPVDLSPRPDHFEGLDAIVIDLQDVGSRYYTYVWSAALMLRAAARAGVPVIALDRPNPLGGEVVEGAPQGVVYRSFVGLYRVPIRHGLTLGEMLQLVVHREKLPAEALTVVTMEGWRREMFFSDTGLPWVLPSPNMPTLDTALVYPGGCLIEGTTLSEGRGTTRPFELMGAPGIDGAALAASVEEPGVVLRPVVFMPTVRKFAGESCGGVQVHITDRHALRSVRLYLRLIHAMTLLRGDKAPWRTEEYEYERRRPAIDLLTGGPAYRQRVNDDLYGRGPGSARPGDSEALRAYLEEDAQSAATFERMPFLLYS